MLDGLELGWGLFVSEAHSKFPREGTLHIIKIRDPIDYKCYI